MWHAVIEAEVPTAFGEVNQRTNIAITETVSGDHLQRGLAQLRYRVRELVPAEHGSRKREAVHVIFQPKYGRAAVGLVTPNAFKYPDAVVQSCRQERHLGCMLILQFSVE